MVFRRAGLRVLLSMLVGLLLGGLQVTAAAQDAQEVPLSLRARVDAAVARVKPALVRIQVVSTHYHGGREVKYQSSGSGVIITPEGHVITNHHVVGHATQLVCTLADKEEVEAVPIGKDPMTDIAVIQLKPESPRTFPTGVFGDSSKVQVGQNVLAMGSPMSLSQSVTLGIVSNTELVMPEWFGRWGKVTMDGEDVGSLVRWIGHDAQIFGGNSGGPLVNLDGEIIGINEISLGLGGAIPGNLAREISSELIKTGEVARAWFGMEVQPRLKDQDLGRGILVSGVLDDSPAKAAGLQAGDILVRVAGVDVNVRFTEELPAFNQLVAGLPIGAPAEAVVRRGQDELTLTVTPQLREKAVPEQRELKQWGITARNLSYLIAKEMKRDNQDGVLVTSVRAGGPAGDAKPGISDDDVLVEVNGQAINNLEELEAITGSLTEGQTEPVTALVAFERESERYLTVVKVGIKELEDPGLEVKKAWLPVKTQVLTRDIAEQLEPADLTGFRITHVFKNSTAEEAGLRVGDYILEVDGEVLTATDPEDYDDLPQLIRQYKVGTQVALTILRGGERLTVPVELVRAPKLPREMKKYRDDDFEFTVRDITFFDRADNKWEEGQRGVLVEEVQSGSWAAVGMLDPGDLLLEVNGQETADVDATRACMEAVAEAKPKTLVLKVLRGIHTAFLELEPKWENDQPKGEE